MKSLPSAQPKAPIRMPVVTVAVVVPKIDRTTQKRIRQLMREKHIKAKTEQNLEKPKVAVRPHKPSAAKVGKFHHERDL